MFDGLPDSVLGEWFILDPDKRSPGLLRREGESFRLTVFTPPERWHLSSHWPKAIHGITENGMGVTLFQCRSGVHRLGVGNTDYHSDLALTGYPQMWFNSLEETEANRAWVQYSTLERWLDRRPELPDISGDSYLLEKPKTLLSEELATIDGVTITLVVRSSLTGSSTNLRLQEIAQLELNSQETIPLPKILHWLRIFRGLLSLLTSSRVKVRQVIVWPAHQEDLGQPSYLEGRSIPHVEDPEPNSSFCRLDMLASRPALGVHFPELAKKWFGEYEKLASCLDLYGYVAHRSDIVLDEAFLNAIRACEVFHRLTVGGTDIPEEDHDERLKAVIGGSPDGLKEWLTEKLRHSNDPSLRRRLKCLWDLAGKGVTSLVPRKRGWTIHQTVAARNLLTHHDPKKERPSYPLIKNLRDWWLVIFEACLLRHFGLEDEVIYPWFEHQSRFSPRYFESGIATFD